MRVPIVVRTFSLLLTLLPAFALAQFRQPTQEELKMTSDPKAPGAAAVVLLNDYLVTVAPQNRPAERERWPIRILRPQGRRYAQCEATYDIDSKLNSIHSWTITAADR